jgi:hypothetical protein
VVMVVGIAVIASGSAEASSESSVIASRSGACERRREAAERERWIGATLATWRRRARRWVSTAAESEIVGLASRERPSPRPVSEAERERRGPEADASVWLSTITAFGAGADKTLKRSGQRRARSLVSGDCTVAGRASDSTDDPGVDASEDDVSEGESNTRESGEEEEEEEEEEPTSAEDSQSRTTAGRGKSQASTRSREGVGAGVLPRMEEEEEEEEEEERAKRFSVGNMAAEVAVSESRCPGRGRRASGGSVR